MSSLAMICTLTSDPSTIAGSVAGHCVATVQTRSLLFLPWDLKYLYGCAQTAIRKSQPMSKSVDQAVEMLGQFHS